MFCKRIQGEKWGNTTSEQRSYTYVFSYKTYSVNAICFSICLHIQLISLWKLSSLFLSPPPTKPSEHTRLYMDMFVGRRCHVKVRRWKGHLIYYRRQLHLECVSHYPRRRWQYPVSVLNLNFEPATGENCDSDSYRGRNDRQSGLTAEGRKTTCCNDDAIPVTSILCSEIVMLH